MHDVTTAIDTVPVNAPRLGEVIDALIGSSDPAAPALLARAAWRCFERYDEAIAAHARRTGPSATLDDMFENNHLLPAVVERLRDGDDEAERLADKVLSITSAMGALGAAYAGAFRIAGDRRLARHQDLVRAYVARALDLEGEQLDDAMHYNLAEAALALAKLDPATAVALLRRPLTAAGDPPAMRLDKLGGVLAGLLVLSPDDPEVRAWTERLLGNRSGVTRVYGVLRGVTEGAVAVDHEALRWHAYHGCGKLNLGAKWPVLRAARAALVALGEPPPPDFDASDEFATRRPVAELVRAVREPHRHSLRHVFKRMVRSEVRSQEVVPVVGPLFAELCRYSDDAYDTISQDLRAAATTILVAQGEAALPALWAVLALPHASAADRTFSVTAMSLIENAPARLIAFASASPEELLAALEPGPTTAGVLDLAAATAFVTLGERAYPAIEAAVRWRASLERPGVDHWLSREHTMTGLLHVATRLPVAPVLFAELARSENVSLAALAGSFGQPHKLVGMDRKASRTLVQERPEPADVEMWPLPTVSWQVGSKGARVTVELAVEEMYLPLLIESGSYEQRASIDGAAPELTDRIVRALGAVGCAPG